MFVNLTNHPVAQWSPEQRDAALALGAASLHDLPGGMPLVPPTASGAEVRTMAGDIVRRVLAMAPVDADGCRADVLVAVQGEPTLTYAIVRHCEHEDIRAFAATTDRKAVEVVNADGTVTKTSVFAFVQWRSY